MVSLKDIAAATGVSVATVSKALNDHNDIGDETKQKVRDVASKLGYVPNAAAKAMKTNRTYNIGVLFVDEANSGLTHDYFSNVLDSFKREVEKRGYDITFISNDRSRQGRTSYLNHARYRHFDGVIIACVKFDDPEVVELVNSDIPVVTIDYLYNDRMSVMSDNVSGMTDLVRYAIEKGHKKLAYIHGHDSAVTTARIKSFYKVLDDNGIDVPDEYIEESDYRDTHGAYEATKRLLELKNPPTCILYPDDYASFGGLRAINEKGLTIPKDISVMGYDGLRLARHMRPRLTSYRQDTDTIGKMAAKQLIGLIEKPKTTIIEQVVIPGCLFEGDTVKDINN